MNYIGSKHSIIDFIWESIIDVVGDDRKYSFCDIFAGTGVVGRYFKSYGYDIIANDNQYYSYVINKHFIENNSNITFKKLKSIGIDNVFIYLNKIDNFKGFIYYNYTSEGTKDSEICRMYFTKKNAIKIDSIRNQIEIWYRDKFINDNEYYYLIACLLEAADKVANTASVYEAFLKNMKKSAQFDLDFKELPILINEDTNNKVYMEDCNELIRHISGDILYMDPPYNERKYNTNYHILETIAYGDNPTIKGVAGVRCDGVKSKYNSRKNAIVAFEDLVKNAKFKYIFLSYNDEGIMSIDDIEKIMKKYGTYKRYEKNHKRYKANKSKGGMRRTTIEYLHVLIKDEEA